MSAIIVKTAVISIAALACAGAAGIAAPIVLPVMGGAGLLGVAGTGTLISSLSGAALTSASGAAVTGTIAGSTTTVAAGGAIIGLAASALTLARKSLFKC